MKNQSSKVLQYLDSQGALVSNGVKREVLSHWKALYNNDRGLIKNAGDLKTMLYREEEKCELLKKKMDLLVKKKEILQWHISNNSKKLCMKRSERKFKVDTTGKLETKLNDITNETRIHKFEYNTVKDEVTKLSRELNKKMNLKEEVEAEFNDLLGRNDKCLSVISKERLQALKERKKRQDQLKELLLVIKKKNNESYNIDCLYNYECNLVDVINNYKTYKTDETKMALQSMNERSFYAYGGQ